MTTKRTSGLNAKEAKLLRTVFLGRGRPAPKTITEMAEGAWPKNPKAGSWTRNSLRKLLKLGILEPVASGTYDFTPNGREIAKLAVEIAPKTPGRKPGSKGTPSTSDEFDEILANLTPAEVVASVG